MGVLVKPTRRHHANCSLCMQMLDTLFGREEEGGRRRRRGPVWWWDGLCCQLPPKTWFSSNNYHYLFPSLTIRDESVMMTSVSFAHCWRFFLGPHLPSLGDSTPAIQVLGGGGGFISGAALCLQLVECCLCKHWAAVHTLVSELVFGQRVKWRGSAAFFLFLG